MNCARIILALAAEADDTLIWNEISMIQPELFAAGPVSVKFAYYGREDASQSRPFISTRWATDADDLAALMEHARDDCECGCFIDVSGILAEAVRETERGPLQAVVIIGGDHFRTDPDHAVALAKQLRAAGTRLFLFQQARGRSACSNEFNALATITDGMHYQFNPHVEGVAQRLPGMLEEITHFALGGLTALAARAEQSESAVLLLDHMRMTKEGIRDLGFDR